MYIYFWGRLACVCGYDFSAVWLILWFIWYDSEVERFWKGWNISNPSFINILNQPSAFWVGRSHDKFIYRCIILIIQHKICPMSYVRLVGFLWLIVMSHYFWLTCNSRSILWFWKIKFKSFLIYSLGENPIYFSFDTKYDFWYKSRTLTQFTNPPWIMYR